MDIDKLEHSTKILEEANIAARQLTEITKVTLMYNSGAPADSCMERIKKIILGDSDI